MIKVVHLISDLGQGGTQTMLYRIIKYQHNKNIQQSVINYTGDNYFEKELKKMGISVIRFSLRKNPFKTILEIWKMIRDTDILCCWMYHSNLLGYILGSFIGAKKIIWNIRHSTIDSKYDKITTIFINFICAKLSYGRRVNTIVYNGEAARKNHEVFGYNSEKGIILENGCDPDEFKKNENASKNLKRELSIHEDKIIILSVTRYYPIKDVPTFIKVFSILHKKNDKYVAVVCGRNMDEKNPELVDLCNEHKIKVGSDIYLLGLREDVPYLMAGCDIFILHSVGEAFPNALLQAMMSECLCITTDVGNARNIINNEYLVVMPEDVMAIVEKVEWLLQLNDSEKKELRNKNRQFVLQQYNIYDVVQKYESLYFH